MRHPRRIIAVTAAALLALTIAACNSAAEQQPGMREGGTLRVAVTSLPLHLDPQRISAALDANVSRLLTRTLTTFKTEAGQASGELAADLATDLGRPSDNNKVWQFKLRDGIKWADGSPITCQHLKFGAERNFADAAKLSLPYARNYLQDNTPAFKGPFGGEELKSVKCPDTKTIEYHLKFPVGDFNYAVALTVFAPVKPGAEGDDALYDLNPLSSGPYMVKPNSRKVGDEERKKETEIAFVRNPHWSNATDKVRKAYPEQILIQANSNTPALTNALIEDAGDARNTIMLMDVAPNFVQQVMTDPQLSARTASGPSGLVRYLAINTKRITNEKCRQALIFAFDKRRFRLAMGGSLIGDLATTMISPTLRAYEKFDHYDFLARNGEANPKRALELMEEAEKETGKPCPKQLTLSHPDVPTTVNRFVKTVVDAYIEIGVSIKFEAIPNAKYFDTIKTFESQDKYDLLWAGWIPDWANGSAVIPPLFKSDAVADEPKELGGSNYSYLRDPEIDNAIQDAMQQSDIQRQWKLWAEIDKKLQIKAVSIPIIYGKAIRMHGSNVGGAYIHSALGMPDIASLGLIDPGAAPPPS